MPFDPNLDEKLFNKTIEFEGSNISVAIHSYDGGTQKIQISRERVNADGKTSFAKLGRMMKDEVKKVIPVLQEALAEME